MFNPGRTVRLFSQVKVALGFALTVFLGFQFLHILAALSVIWLVDCSHSSDCEVRAREGWVCVSVVLWDICPLLVAPVYLSSLERCLS